MSSLPIATLVGVALVDAVLTELVVLVLLMVVVVEVLGGETVDDNTQSMKEYQP